MNSDGEEEEEGGSQAPGLVSCVKPSAPFLSLQELRSTYQAALLGEIWALHPQHRAPGQPPDHPPLPGKCKGWAALAD